VILWIESLTTRDPLNQTRMTKRKAVFFNLTERARLVTSYTVNTVILKYLTKVRADQTWMNDPEITLPGEELIQAGLRDLRAGQETIAALLVAIGAPKLRSLGIDVPQKLPQTPEHRLYALLARNNSDSAHSRYNALIRRLVSFERAAVCVKR